LSLHLSSVVVLARLISASRRELFTLGLEFFKLSVVFWLEVLMSGSLLPFTSRRSFLVAILRRILVDGCGLVGTVGFPGYH
ncbi:12151_t:CDS:2, partial [Ambispora gerdemannii]